MNGRASTVIAWLSGAVGGLVALRAADGRTDPPGAALTYELPAPEVRFVTRIPVDASYLVTTEIITGLGPIPVPGITDNKRYGAMLVSSSEGTTRAVFKLGANPDGMFKNWVVSYSGIYSETGGHLNWHVTTAYGFNESEWAARFKRATEATSTTLSVDGITWQLSGPMDPITITTKKYFPGGGDWQEISPYAHHSPAGPGDYSNQECDYKVVTSPTLQGTVIFWHEVTRPHDGSPESRLLRQWTVDGKESPKYHLKAPPNSSVVVEFYTPQALLAVDADRDGEIRLDGSDSTSADQPYRFWINDDDDAGDISETGPSLVGNPDEPGRLAGFWEWDGRTPDHEQPGVDGRSDLLDFIPVYLDIRQLLTMLPHTSSGVTYKLKQADSALSFVYTDLTRAEAFDYLKHSKERVAYGPLNDQKRAHEAPTVAITDAGVALAPDFLARILNEPEKGVILIEGKQATDEPLRLVVEKSGVEIAEASLPVKINEVESMYRWVNLRGVTGQSVTRSTDLGEPTGYPDSFTNGKMFIFVHGYNVNERQSRAWNAEAFKRLWQSGSRAMFTAVSWNGDHSQIPYAGVAPDYWDNITRAFRTAQALAPVVNGLPGSSKVIAGHSMGNVVTSSAIVDHGMSVTKYLMVNAAVALEAYDTSAMAVDAMRHPDWDMYTDHRVWPTEWHRLFPADDGRRGLTWKDRFGNIGNAVNIYSSGENVLNNNDATPGEIPDISTERIWIIQEMAKGTTHLAALLTFDIQGGWGLNRKWLMPETNTTGGPHGGTTTTYRRRTLSEAALITDDQLREEPFFRPFKNDAFTSPTGGSAAALDPVARADALGGAIPALSFPAGRNPVLLFDASNRNRDLMSRQDGWPLERFSTATGWVQGTSPKKGRWWHSDIKNVAYVFNRGAWDLFVTEGDLK